MFAKNTRTPFNFHLKFSEVNKEEVSVNGCKDTVDVDAPYSSIVAIEGPQPLSVTGIPDCRFAVFGNGEQEIPFQVVSD